MSKPYKAVAKKLRAVLAEGCDLTRSLLVMYRCGQDVETRELMEAAYADLWTLSVRISRALRAKDRTGKRRRRKLAPPTVADAVADAVPDAVPVADQVGDLEPEPVKPKRRQRKRELWEKLTGKGEN